MTESFGNISAGAIYSSRKERQRECETSADRTAASAGAPVGSRDGKQTSSGAPWDAANAAAIYEARRRAAAAQ